MVLLPSTAVASAWSRPWVGGALSASGSPRLKIRTETYPVEREQTARAHTRRRRRGEPPPRAPERTPTHGTRRARRPRRRGRAQAARREQRRRPALRHLDAEHGRHGAAAPRPPAPEPARGHHAHGARHRRVGHRGDEARRLRLLL